MSGGRVFRTGSARTSHIRALFDALVRLEELLPAEPSWKRVSLRDHRAALVRAYPQLKLSEVDVAQYCAEEDGDAVSE